MDFPTFVILVVVAVINGFVLHSIIRSAVAGGIADARKKAVRERAELKAIQIEAERKKRPVRGDGGQLRAAERRQ